MKRLLRTLFVRPSDALRSSNPLRAAAYAAVETLERRQLLTVTPTGLANVNEGSIYSLGFSTDSTQPIDHWTANWNDG